MEGLLPDYWRTRIHHLMEGLTKEEQAVLIGLLNKVTDKMMVLTQDKGEKNAHQAVSGK